MFRLLSLMVITLFFLSHFRIEAMNPNSMPPICNIVSEKLDQCAIFLQDPRTIGKPSLKCCSAAEELNEMACSKHDKIAICECLTEFLQSVESYKLERIPQITKQCGLEVVLPPIHRDTDCSKLMMMKGDGDWMRIPKIKHGV